MLGFKAHRFEGFFLCMIRRLKLIEFDVFFCCKILGVRAHDVEGFLL